MPRKSKEELKNNETTKNSMENDIKKSKSTKQKNVVAEEATSNLSSSKSKKTDSVTSKRKNSTSKKASTASASKKATSKNSKNSTTKKATSTKKNSTAKSSTTKKTSTTKASTRKTSKKNSVATKESKSPIVEYYDLPYRYNETTVKILAQTPTMLFIYWDISDADRAIFVEKYGEDFFNKTKPVLIVRNKTMNYTFEVEINDFANSWYLHVNDADCDYSVELGRRPIEYNTTINNYVYVTTSNDMEMPNNHILFDKLGKSVFFRNVKTNFSEEVPITSMSFIKRLGKVYNIYELYKEIYKDEINIEELNSNDIKLNLSSSSSSTFM